MNGEEYGEFPKLQRPKGLKWPGFPKWAAIFLVTGALVSGFAIWRWSREKVTPTNVVTLHESQSVRALNIVILGDGFTAATIDHYYTAADAFASRIKEVTPFVAARDTFNIYRVDVISQEDGIDVPNKCGDYVYAHPPHASLEPWARKQRNVNTALGTTFCASGSTKHNFIDSADWPSIWAYANASGVFPDVVVVLVNDWMSGATAWANAGLFNGSGGVAFATIRKNTTDEINPITNAVILPQVPTAFPDVAIHETGHLGPFRLRDEYGTKRTAVDPADQLIIDGSPNLTTSLVAPIKWESLRTPGATAPIVCPDPFAPDPSLPDAGVAPGGNLYAVGVFHARCDCRMHDFFSDTFCVVCRRQILDALAGASSFSSPAGASTFRLVLDSFRLKTLPAGQYFLEFKVSHNASSVLGRWPKSASVALAAKTEEPGFIVVDLAVPPVFAAANKVDVAYTIFGQDSASNFVALEQQTVSVTLPAVGRGSIEQFDHATHRVTFGFTRR